MMNLNHNALSDQETDAFVFLSGQFPEMNGTEIIQSIRSNGANVNRCIVELTNKRNLALKKQVEIETAKNANLVCKPLFLKPTSIDNF